MTWTNEPEFEGGEGLEIVSGFRLIATVYDPTDAHLIAAAPNLLAALENLTVLFDRMDRSGATNKAAYNDAIAAIAKAKGA
jgi:hypothetical protein